MAGRYSGAFDETKSVIYELFSTRHNRRQVWYEHLLEIALGLYLVAMMFLIELAAIPGRVIWSWVQRGWGATFGRVQLPHVGTKVLWWVFGGVGAVVIGLAVWVIINTLGGQ